MRDSICLVGVSCCVMPYLFFFFNDTATTEIYTLSLHDALPISHEVAIERLGDARVLVRLAIHHVTPVAPRSEEHTSELQSRLHLVCRLLLEKKKTSPRSAQCAPPHHPVPHESSCGARSKRLAVA